MTEASPTSSPWLSPDQEYSLQVLDGNEPGAIFPIEKASVVLGRKNCDIVIDDPEVSRRHASLNVYGNEAILEDVGSGNGTFVEGLRIDRERLRNGDQFRMGTHQLVFLIADR